MADVFDFVLNMKTVEGAKAVDPNVTLTFVAAFGGKNINIAQLAVDGSGTVIGVSTDGTPMFADATCSLFRSFRLGPFTPASGQPVVCTATAVRNSSDWKPEFTPLGALPAPRFDRLRAVIGQSDAVDVLGGPTLGSLAGAYETIAGDDILAKMCLLNLYAVLSDETNPISNKPWFDHVKRIVRIGRERFISEVDAELYNDIKRILDAFDHYGSIGYFTEPDPGAHAPNFPDRYGAKSEDIISVKYGYEQGNVQFTLVESNVGGVVTYLMDCDMDEHSQIVLHGIDCVAHNFDGGTNPFDMHEYIVHDSAEINAGAATVELGYQLIAPSA